MKIIIVGAGEVGFHIAQRLAQESKEVVVIDKRADALRRFTDLLDVKTIHGSGSNPRVLEEAGVKDAETFLAVTDSDETNLVSCLFANGLSPGINKLARIRDEGYFQYKPELTKRILDISSIINPEVEVVKTIQRAIATPGTDDVSEFADGRIKLISIRIASDSPVRGITLLDLRKRTGELRFIVGAILRNDRLIIPFGQDSVESGDTVLFVCGTEEMQEILSIFGIHTQVPRNILIVGGGNIGLRLAQSLEKTYHLRLLERDRERCNVLAAQLDRTVIINGDGTDQALLEEENIRRMDVVVSVTGNEETNVLLSLLAKRLGAKRTITRIDKFAYIPIASAIGLGTIVSSRLSAIGTILQHVRRGKVISAVSLKGEEAEVLEAIALETSEIVGRPLKDLHFPDGVIVLAILRGKESFIPTGSTVINPQDRVVILATRQSIPSVEEQLAVKLEYF